MALPLSPPLFTIFSGLIEERAGLHYDARETELLAEKLSTRATELGYESLLDYYYFLRYDEGGPRELDALIDALVVNETYFFRESDQLRALVDQLIPARLQADATRPCRVWCAAASTGEEPLTLAMMLDECGLLPRVEILATDISTRVLAKAAIGKYGGRSLRALSDADRRRHFQDAGGGMVSVHDPVRARVRWQRVNLFDTASVRALGRFDFILCRNALIYFRDEAVLRLVASFADSLEPKGVLLVGASESLLRFGTVFDCEEHAGAFFYRKSRGSGMKTDRIRVLVVDDSAFARKVIREVLEHDPRFEVVGIARDGLDALEKITDLHPDVVTLDLVMPNLDGVGVLRALGGLGLAQTPRVVIVSMAEEDSDLAVSALQLGAIDLVRKPTALATDRLFELSDELLSKVNAAAIAVPAHARASHPPSPVPGAAKSLIATTRRIVVIGASTGGPQALTRLLTEFPKDYPVPIAVVLHIPVGYTEALSRRLDGACAIEVVEAYEGIELRPGRAVIARAGMHLNVMRGDPATGRLTVTPLDKPHRPAVDVLFTTAAEAFGESALGVVLTGMGDDGSIGSRALRAAGAPVLTEAESSCVVYGMPRAVKEAGFSTGEAELDRMAEVIQRQP